MKDLSIIVPAFNAGASIVEAITSLHQFMLTTQCTFEIIVVDDGSTDCTPQVLTKLTLPNISTISLAQNQGKFGAVRVGMAQAKGNCRIFTDCDMPYDFQAIPYITHLINTRGFHIVIGDRSLPESESVVQTSPLRKLASRIFSNILRLAVTGEIYDSQCGLKGFRGDVADALFPMLTDNGFSGDTELLYIALKYNLEIRRIPVKLEHIGPSSVRVLRHGLVMLRRMLNLRRNWKKGVYRSAALDGIASQKYWQN